MAFEWIYMFICFWDAARGRANRALSSTPRLTRENKGELNVLIYAVVNLLVRVHVAVRLFNN